MFLSNIANWSADNRRHLSPRRRAASLHLESLEARDVPATLSNGLLTVEGTRYDDTIRVSQGGGEIRVETSYTAGNSGERSADIYPLSKVSRIKILGYEGKDTINLSGVSVAAEVRGGPQNDTIYGGTGDDTLYGEAGNDLLNGEAGRDRVYGDIGQDTIFGVYGEDKVLQGNADNDKLYMTFNLDTFYKFRGHDAFAEGISGVDTFYVTMDLGTTGRNLIGKFIEQVKQFTRELQPIANLLNTRLPLPGGRSSPTLGQFLGGNYQNVANLIMTVNQFDASSFKAGSFNLGTFKVDASWNVTTVASGTLGSQGFAGQLSKLGKYLDVSFLTDATKAFKIAMNYDTIELFRLDLGSYSVSSGRLNQYLGTYPVGPVPVTLNLVGSLNLKLGGSIVYDITGLRENNLIRGLKINSARAELSAPVAIEATAGGTFPVLGQTLTPGVGGGGEIKGVVTVSTGNVRLGSGQNVASNVSASGRLNYRLYLFATYPEAYWKSPFDNGIGWKRAESNIFNGSLPM